MKSRHFLVTIFALSSACLFFLPPTWAQGTITVPQDLVVYPELIVYNGKIVTMNDSEINSNIGTIMEAMAVRDGRVWKLGKNDEVLKYAGPNTKRINVGGRTVIPGIINVHTHIHEYALNEWVDAHPEAVAVKVFRVKGEDVAEIKKNLEVLIKERMGNVPADQWTFFYLPNPEHGVGGGPGFDLARKALMSASEIDKLGVKSPVILAAHPAYVINTPAMEALKKIYGGEPAGGLEDWNEDGFAGLGVEYRREAVVDGYFNDKTDLLKEILHTGLLENAAAGITTFSSHIMGIQNFDAYMRLYRENRFPIRFGFTHYTGFQVNKDPAGFYRRLGDMFKLGNEYFWFQGIGAGFIDNGPPLMCSSMVPKEDIEKHGYNWCRNAPGTPHYETLVTALSNGTRVVAGHNYGDISNGYFMDMIEDAMRRNPEITLDYIRSLRLSVDHGGMFPRPDQLPRMKRLGMIMSMDTSSMSRSLPWIVKYGWEKYQGWVVPVKRVLEAGIKVAWHGEGAGKEGLFSKFIGFLTRKTQQGVYINRDQAIDRNTLLKMATNWGSEFLLKEKELGSLEPGKFADFLILNQDYFSVPLEQFDKTFPLMTVVGGKIVFLRSEFANDLGMEPVGAQIRYSFENQSNTKEGASGNGN